MALSDTRIRNAKPGAKPAKLYDERGLFVMVTPAGGKWWRLRYRFNEKEKLLSLGTYPDVSLAQARERRDEARKLLAAGIDPGEHRKATSAARAETVANAFEVVAREWLAKSGAAWNDDYRTQTIAKLEKNAFPWLGKRPVSEITAPEVLAVLRRIEARGATHTAHTTKSCISRVIRYAIATGRAERDPVPDLRGALEPISRGNFASITNPSEVGELLRAMDAFKGTLVVKCALVLSPLLFARPSELRRAEWADIDLDNAEWRYLVTKTKTEQLVPLSRQAVAILKDLHALTGHGRHVFPGRDPKYVMSNVAVNAALRRLGYDTKTEITGHGFRAMARTILHEELHQKPEVIEHQLAHKVPDALGSAYNRTKFLKERRLMMQLWADYLDKLKAGAEVIQLREVNL